MTKYATGWLKMLTCCTIRSLCLLFWCSLVSFKNPFLVIHKGQQFVFPFSYSHKRKVNFLPWNSLKEATEAVFPSSSLFISLKRAISSQGCFALKAKQSGTWKECINLKNEKGRQIFSPFWQYSGPRNQVPCLLLKTYASRPQLLIMRFPEISHSLVLFWQNFNFQPTVQ